MMRGLVEQLNAAKLQNLPDKVLTCSLGNSLVITAVGGGTHVIPFLTGELRLCLDVVGL